MLMLSEDYNNTVAASSAEDAYNKQAFLPIIFPEPDELELEPEPEPEEPEPEAESVPETTNANANEWFEIISGRLIHNKIKKDETVRTDVGPALHVRALVRDENGTGWSHLVEWTDADGTQREYALSDALLCKTGAPWLSELLDRGYTASVEHHKLLNKYITSETPQARYTSVARLGWSEDTYIFPDVAVANDSTGRDGIYYSGNITGLYEQNGTLEEWKKTVSQASGNSLYVLALCAAFAAPLLKMSCLESGGIHIYGKSSHSKTTSLLLASSVWGNSDAHLKSWRTTDNALESIASQFNDNLLILDELGQCSARACSEAAYMLGNGAGKSRAKGNGSARPVARWRLLFLSAGELSLADKLAENGQKPRAGQEVRFIDIATSGVKNSKEVSEEEGKELSNKIKTCAREHYGHAGRAWIQYVVENYEDIKEHLCSDIQSFIQRITQNYKSIDGQVQRVAERFALFAVAGRLAVEAGILPLPMEEPGNVLESLFAVWVEARGGTGPAEDRTILAQVVGYLERHGNSRFQNISDPLKNITNRTGYKCYAGTTTTYLILPEAWKNEVCKGLNPQHAARVLEASGLLVREAAQRLTCRASLPGLGQVGVYKLVFNN